MFMRVHIFDTPTDNAINHWRFFKPFEAITKRYRDVHVTMSRSLSEIDLYTIDIFIVSRPTDTECLNLMRRIKLQGRSKIIMDIDDNLTNLPINHTLYMDYADRRNVILECMALADFFWLSNENIAYAADCLDRYLLAVNAIKPSELPDKPSADTGTFMWRGRDVQKEDVYQVGAETYESIKHQAKRFVFWGCLPNLPHANNVTILPLEKTGKYFQMLKLGKFNCVWKPLAVNNFNDCKSNIAWIEATMSGGICLTNYADRLDIWKNALTHYPDSEKERNAIWEKSCEDILENYNLDKIAQARYESMVQLL